jgi:hypothetical protein
LIPLAERARAAATGVIRSDEWFEHYLNPFEVFQINDVVTVEELDPKVVQRAKKMLLNEIRVNDGKVAWLGDYALDASKVHKLDDELLDRNKARYHWSIFKNKPLLRFLTRGDIEHFLYSTGYFPQATLVQLDEDLEFRRFLSKSFARQYNVVLTRAIERRLLPVVEVLFDGRRWVEPEDEDTCFEGAYKYAENLIEEIQAVARKARARKVGRDEIEDCLRRDAHPELFNLLPVAFAHQKHEAVKAILELAITCNNKPYYDYEMAKSVLIRGGQFTCQDVELAERLAATLNVVEENCGQQRLAQERERAATVEAARVRALAEKQQREEEERNSFSGWVRSNLRLQINKAGIVYGEESMDASAIEAIRWGVFVQTINGIENEHSFSFVVRSAHTSLSVRWDKPDIVMGWLKGFFRNRDAVLPIAELPTREQDTHFQAMIGAVCYHLVPALIVKLLRRIQGGGAVVIGPCTVNHRGLGFRTGLIFSKDHFLSWQDAVTQMQNGRIYVLSRTDQKVQVSMSAKDTDNAVLLPILCDALRKRPN